MLSEAFVTLVRRQRRVQKLLDLVEARPRSTAALAAATGRPVREVAAVMGWLGVLTVVERREIVVVFGPRGGRAITATRWHLTGRPLMACGRARSAPAAQMPLLPAPVSGEPERGAKITTVS